MSDDDLTTATDRVMAVLGCESYENVHDGEIYCRKHQIGWAVLADYCPRAWAVARAARRDVPEIVVEKQLDKPATCRVTSPDGLTLFDGAD